MTINTYKFTNGTDAHKFAGSQGGPVSVSVIHEARGKWIVEVADREVTISQVKAGMRYQHRGVVKTVRTVLVFVNTVNVYFEDGSEHFAARGTRVVLK